MYDVGLVNREEFEQHGLGGVVIATCRDVFAEGFGIENIADAGTYIFMKIVTRLCVVVMVQTLHYRQGLIRNPSPPLRHVC